MRLKNDTFKMNNDDKLICGRTARKYLNCSKAEFENLVNQGRIQAYRDEYMRWKVSKESVLNYAKQSQVSNVTRFITNKSHYEEVVGRICSAKSSIRIMTANFKRFRLKPTENQGRDYNDGTPFIERLMTPGTGTCFISKCTNKHSETHITAE